ncbi:MAG: amidohydrolase [Clostridia bacterium]|nr:amidohydrolase [Clostridia bacterium]
MIDKIINSVYKHREKILKVLDFMWDNPESGFREWKANSLMIEEFEKLGYDLVKAENIPGFYTVIDTGKPGPTVLVMGELDALSCPTHFHANPETGMAHACGHNAQSAALLGVAAALKEPGILDGLCGKIKLCSVPAEETGELEFRAQLKKDGIIKEISGKREFISRGYFDDCDIAFLVHTLPVDYYSVDGKAVGVVAKKATYKGVASHAGANPHKGKNALYAATQGLAAINSIRETFQEKDYIRVHPIITEGGGAVNTIPDRVTIESYVRGLNYDALKDANDRVNRALCGSAVSLGCEIEIEDMAGSSPLIENEDFANLAGEAIKLLKPDAKFYFFNKIDTGSTDMGDVSCLMPVIHPYIPGASGRGHGKDYEISDPDTACCMSAKWQIMIIRLLLENDAVRAMKIIDEFEPRFSNRVEYLAAHDSLSSSGDRVFYGEDGKITIDI